MVIQKIFNLQKNFFFENRTRPIATRVQILKKLKLVLQQNEKKLFEAIFLDFKKSEFETYMTELALVYQEIQSSIKNIEKWSASRPVSVEAIHLPSSAYIVPEPYGVCLVIGAWNYPYQLSLLPAVSAIAAGNTVIIKPSELPINTSKVMAEIINSNFEASILQVVEGEVEVTQELLKLPFDKIFFTGSTLVGKIVAKAAAENLTPVTLELGGKSPCFVYADADLDISAKRIVWAKFINAGQTCVAPDFLCVEESIYDIFLQKLKSEIILQFGKKNSIAENFCQIINTKNTQRLKALINPQNLYFGGEVNLEDRYISPTILKDITFDLEIMKDEIFGPILPVIKMTDEVKTIIEIKKRPKPLAFYVFTKNISKARSLIDQISFGGGTINDCLMHLAVHDLPFGGVGPSGVGSYHGEAGFKCFSHEKSILQKNFLFEPKFKYAPYSKWKLKLVRLFAG